MFWVGGAPGSGKSTVVRRLAGELDLTLHPVDAYTYDHLERLGPLGPPLDEVLALGAVAAADDFERTSALRLPVVMDDVRAAHACVCGRSGCTDTTPATSAEYRAHEGSAPPTLDH